MAGAYEALVTADAPIAWWWLNETSGTVATDHAGTHNGTYTLDSGGSFTLNQAGPPRAAGQSGAGNNAVLLDGAQAWISVPDDAAWSCFTSAFSVEAWVYPTSVQATGPFIIDRGNPRQFLLGYSWATNQGSCYLKSMGTGISTGGGGTYFQLNTWNHIVGTRTAAGVLACYVNGLAGPNIQDDGTARVSNASILAIGRDSQGANGYLAGRLAQVAVYNYALTPAQVFAHFNTGVTAFIGEQV